MSNEERIIEVMGTTAHVIAVDGPDGLADEAVDGLRDLEARWSRFRPDSEVSRMNGHAGTPVLVSASTLTLVERARAGCQLADGRFDPTLLPELCAAGYDRSFELVGSDATGRFGARAPAPTSGSDRRRRDCDTITVDRTVGAVTLGEGVQFDPGGIGKGLAADLVVERLRSAGARGAMVNVGGDLRADGTPPEGRWIVAVTDPTSPDRVIATLALHAGAVASTWRTKRAWTAPDGTTRHHLIDPSTGRSASTGLAGVTVVAGKGWEAEVLAKAAFVAGPVAGAELLEAQRVAGLLVADDGSRHEVGTWRSFQA